MKVDVIGQINRLYIVLNDEPFGGFSNTKRVPTMKTNLTLPTSPIH